MCFRNLADHFFFENLRTACLFRPLTQAWSLSTGHMCPNPEHGASPQGECVSPRARHVSMAQTCLHGADISLSAREKRLGRFDKSKIGPNMFFSDLTNDQ